MQNVIRFVLTVLALMGPLVVAAQGVTVPGDKVVKNVYLEAEALNYYGDLNPLKNQHLFAIYDAAKVKPKRLLISSRGGDIVAGMALGEFVWRQKLDLEVVSHCLSSCANYVFTAARHRVLHQTATLGWHGGASSQAASMTLSGLDAVLSRFPEAERRAQREKIMQGFEIELGKLKQKETQFFHLIGVDARIVHYGQEGHYKAYSDDARYKGWYYDLDDLPAFGIGPTRVKGGQWRPESDSDAFALYKVDVD